MPKFAIVVEGVDCSGKTTLIHALPVPRITKPVGDDLPFVRHVKTALMFLGVEDEVGVLFDRYSLSTRVYAHAVDGVSPQIAHRMAQSLDALVKPELVLLLDISEETFKKRLYERVRPGPHDQYEQYTLDNFKRIRSRFLQYARLYNSVVINGNLSPDHVEDCAMVALNKICNQKRMKKFW